MPDVDVNGFQLHYEDRGAGDPLLLLHGGTGIGADWQLVFTSGEPGGFRVVVPDLRGHGRSTNPSGTFTFRQCAKDMFALLDRVGVERTKAIGLSAGLCPMAGTGRSSGRWPRRSSRPPSRSCAERTPPSPLATSVPTGGDGGG